MHSDATPDDQMEAQPPPGDGVDWVCPCCGAQNSTGDGACPACGAEIRDYQGHGLLCPLKIVCSRCGGSPVRPCVSLCEVQKWGDAQGDRQAPDAP